MQDISKHPLFKNILKAIDNNLEPLERFVEEVSQSLPVATLTFDYEYILNVRSEAKRLLEVVEQYLKELEKAYKETEEIIKALYEAGNERDPFEMPVSIELAYYDMTRPILNRIKDLKEIIELTDKLLT